MRIRTYFYNCTVSLNSNLKRACNVHACIFIRVQSKYLNFVANCFVLLYLFMFVCFVVHCMYVQGVPL